MAHTDTIPDQHIVAIDISQPLGTKPELIAKYLVVSIGDKITEGMVLAQKKSFLGIDSIEIQSPVSGIVTNIDNDRGVIMVQIGLPVTHDEPGQVPPQVGTETSSSQTEVVLEPQQIVVEESPAAIEPQPATIEPKIETKQEPEPTRTPSVSGKVITGIYGFKSGEGNAWLVGPDFNEKMIVPQMKDKILLLPFMPNLHQLFKASAVGIEGFVVASNDIEAVQQVATELTNKSHLSFLVLPDGTNLATLHNKHVQIIGEDKQLIVS